MIGAEGTTGHCHFLSPRIRPTEQQYIIFLDITNFCGRSKRECTKNMLVLKPSPQPNFFLLIPLTKVNHMFKLEFTEFEIPSPPSERGNIRDNISVLFFFCFGHPVVYGILGSGIRSELHLQLHCSCSNTGSFNSLCRARDQTCVLALQRCCTSHCTTVGTPNYTYF